MGPLISFPADLLRWICQLAALDRVRVADDSDLPSAPAPSIFGPAPVMPVAPLARPLSGTAGPSGSLLAPASATGAPGSVCAYRRRPAVCSVWGRRMAVWAHTPRGPHLRGLVLCLLRPTCGRRVRTSRIAGNLQHRRRPGAQAVKGLPGLRPPRPRPSAGRRGLPAVRVLPFCSRAPRPGSGSLRERPGLTRDSEDGSGSRGKASEFLEC